MKYSFMSFSCPEANLEEFLSLAKRFGYDAVEPRAGTGHKHGIELEADADARKAIGEQAARSGIALCCIAVSCGLANPQTADEQVERTHRYRCIAPRRKESRGL